MKKTLLLLLAVLPVATWAQENEINPLKFGVQAGANYSGVRGNDQVNEFDGAVNYLVGVSLEVPLSNKFSLLTNLNFERKSHATTIQLVESDPFDPVFQYGEYDIRFTQEYLVLPVNLKYYIGGKKRLYVNGGVYAGYLLNSITRVDGRSQESAGESGQKNFDFGVNLGLGMRFPINANNDINIELRDNLGLANVSDIDVPGNTKVRTNSASLIIAWQFKL